MPETMGSWVYDQGPFPPTDPGQLIQGSEPPQEAALFFHAVDDDGVDRSGLFGVLAPGDTIRIAGQDWTVVAVTDEAAAYPAVWRVDVTPQVFISAWGQRVSVWFTTAATPPDPVPPEPGLGPTDVYASPEELAGYLGGAGSAHDQRRSLALITASRWVAYRIGVPLTDDPIPPGDITVTPVPARPAWRAATLVVATRFYRSSDAVFGAMGGLGDDAVYVRAAIPEAELLLVGQTVSWGIA